MALNAKTPRIPVKRELLLGEGVGFFQRAGAFLGHATLLGVTSISALSVLFIFAFITYDAFPFLFKGDIRQFFTSANWYPAADPPAFGALSIFVGSGLVTAGAVVFATPLGVVAGVCLSDVLPFNARQIIKPVIEILAAIPSVAYGFFALVIFAPLLQSHGGPILAVSLWVVVAPILALTTIVVSDLSTAKVRESSRGQARAIVAVVLGALFLAFLWWLSRRLYGLEIHSGRNALNASIILGIMALPTVVSVSEDALTAVGRELREGSYALGATRAETLTRVVVPAAGSGILAAALLGVMRAVGETMVVWMAAGNAAQIPEPWYDLMTPVRTLTATIAGDMGETPIGSEHYHSLFLMGFCLLTFSFVCNMLSEWAVRRERKKLRS